MPVSSLLMLASPNLEGWPLSSQRFEAETGSLSLRLAPSAFRGFDDPVTQNHRPVSYMSHRHFYMVSSFQLTREARLRLAHQITVE